jgi:hypothetical protein
MGTRVIPIAPALHLLDISKESSHNAEDHRRPSGRSRPDIRLWWRRTGAAERTEAATSEALGLVAGRPGRTRSGPSSACRQSSAEKAESTSHRTNTSHTSEETIQHTRIPHGRRSEPSLRTTRNRRPQPPLVSGSCQPRRWRRSAVPPESGSARRLRCPKCPLQRPKCPLMSVAMSNLSL